MEYIASLWLLRLVVKKPEWNCFKLLQDKGGHIATVTQPFSLDTEPISTGLFQAFVLQANLPTGVSS